MKFVGLAKNMGKFMEGIKHVQDLVEASGLTAAEACFIGYLNTGRDNSGEKYGPDWISGVQAGVEHYRFLEARGFVVSGE